MSTETITEVDAAVEKKARVATSTKTWLYAGRFGNAQAAVTYINTPPAQQAGEAVFSVHDDGTVDVFAFLAVGQ